MGKQGYTGLECHMSIGLNDAYSQVILLKSGIADKTKEGIYMSGYEEFLESLSHSIGGMTHFPRDIGREMYMKRTELYNLVKFWGERTNKPVIITGFDPKQAEKLEQELLK